MFKNILVAVDDSLHAKAAVEYAAYLAAEFGTRIFETAYLDSDSHVAILEHARQKGCDLLAMGAFADRDVEVLALGTTTEALLRLSHIPALAHR